MGKCRKLQTACAFGIMLFQVSCSYQARYLHKKGDYREAVTMTERSLAFRKAILGPEHKYVATSLNDLGELHRILGDYKKAEDFYKRSLAVYLKNLGPEHYYVGTVYNNLGVLYHTLGDYVRAEFYFQKSLEIRVKALGTGHRYVAQSLNNLAEIRMALGDYPASEELFKKSLSANEKGLGSDHPDVAINFNNLGYLYAITGDYGKAGAAYEKSLKILEKKLGPEHPDVSISLNNLGMLYSSMGEYGLAEPLLKRSLSIAETCQGPEHPDVGIRLNNLSALYAAKGDYENAFILSKRGQYIDGKNLDHVIGFASEEQKLKFLSTRTGSLHSFLSLVALHRIQDPSARKTALDVWLRRKGVILESQKRFQEALLYSDDPEAAGILQDLSQIRNRLSRLIFSGPGDDGIENHKKKIMRLEVEKAGLESRLSKLSEAFLVSKKIGRATGEKVARALPENSAMIEFARIGIFNFRARGRENRWEPDHYLAFVLCAGGQASPGLIDLGEAAVIDNYMADFKKEIALHRNSENERTLDLSKKLYNKIFSPLQKELGEVRNLFVCPDGNLNLFPFEVLKGPDGRYLIEEYSINYLGAGRDIMGFGQVSERGKKALLIGDPDFDMGFKKQEPQEGRSLSGAKKERRSYFRSPDMHGFLFKRLPGTREEVLGIQKILGNDLSDVYTGGEAAEGVLMRKKPPLFLHLATHGFFLKDLDNDLNANTFFERGVKIVSVVSKKRKKEILIENPLLRSGVALAGANSALREDVVEKSNGIVTAEKILGLKLFGTDMVVLSACETGLGEVKKGEGVFGLRRAFTRAGTKSLVMSMWSVPDRETKELMVEFYRNILSGRMNRCQALRLAALHQMSIVRKRYGHTNPFFWGAFVFLGEP